MKNIVQKTNQFDHFLITAAGISLWHVKARENVLSVARIFGLIYDTNAGMTTHASVFCCRERIIQVSYAYFERTYQL